MQSRHFVKDGLGDHRLGYHAREMARLVVELTDRCQLRCGHCPSARHGGRGALSLALLGRVLALAPAVSARQLDLGAAATQPLAAGLGQDLGPLLAMAAFRRNPDEPDAPRHVITSVDRIVAALRAHRGPAWVALGERRDGGAEVRLLNLYVLDGAPIGGALPPAPAGVVPQARPGLRLDLQGAAAKPLRESLGLIGDVPRFSAV